MITLRTACVLVMSALALAACSSSGSPSTSPTSQHDTSTSPASPTSSAPTSSAPASGATPGAPSTASLQALLLQPGDLPATWKATAHDSSDDADDAKAQTAMSACVGIRDTTGDRLATAHSADYALGQSSIQSDVNYMKSESDVDSDVALFSAPKVHQCYEQLVGREAAAEIPSGAKIKSLDVSVKPGTNGGPSNVVAVITGVITVSESGQTATVYADNYSIRGPKLEASVDVTGLDAPVSAAVQKAAVAKVAARVAKG